MAELMIEAMGDAGDRGAVLVRFAESVSSDEARVLRRALDDVTGRAFGSMSLLVAAGVLGLFSVVLLGPMSTWLARARWVIRAPRSAVALWQSIGLGAIASGIGAGFAVSVYRYHAGFTRGVGELVEGLASGHPVKGLGVPEALGLTLAADLLIVLLVLFGTLMARTTRSRARHRRLLNLLARPSSDYPGTDLLENSRPVAYCLPGRHPRIVISEGALRLLSSSQAQRRDRTRAGSRSRAPRVGHAAHDRSPQDLRLGSVCAARPRGRLPRSSRCRLTIIRPGEMTPPTWRPRLCAWRRRDQSQVVRWVPRQGTSRDGLSVCWMRPATRRC